MLGLLLMQSVLSDIDICARTLEVGRLPARYGLRQFEMSLLRLLVWNGAGFVWQTDLRFKWGGLRLATDELTVNPVFFSNCLKV